ncbi:MAG: hypothetical protein COU22_03615 [Candidatus Komeilibacteria bacterium CG10_big_fil_rev_8_21_14_0_10_41_13]|uniref:BioF2-like acetyltransferase domain-containing protein n=1 Tax=Candidatus Komeilibacteria bacterium CG10_big_fil_rev_8_21_14_0_10_41_13 TaxID=1974476 RepID=A0A2M6WBM8_9BACT|nr:MAG: hypothetical protein COU22_03615 [Candidatus Komeilibacteria bacterium CG10_big_fil_rev_8_21_14_0_10_41_13]
MNRIEFREIDKVKDWQNFVQSFDFYTFLQSWQWGEFQELSGEKIWRFGGYLDNRLLLTCLVIKVKARRGTFLLCPHGPLFKDDKLIKPLTDFLASLADQEKANFIRLSTAMLSTKQNAKKLESLGYRFAPMHVHTETTWLLDVSKDQQTLLAEMRKTARQMIKRAEKEGVEVVKDNSETGIEKFIAMHKKHALEAGYEAFSAKFIKNLFEAFDQNSISLKFANYQGQTEAASVIIFYGKQAVYYLAATDTKHSKFSPSYLLQWQSILEAKSKGCKVYNFWGVSPDDNPKHPIQGVSAFKRGFGGYQLDLLHAYDYPINGKYRLNWLIETLRRIKRKYYFIKPEF